MTQRGKPAAALESRARIDRAFEVLRDLPSAKGLFELGQHTRVVVSRLWAGAGGSALWRRVNLPPWSLEWPAERLAPLLAHELVHVRQGITLFGSIDSEREAYVTQCRVELDLLLRQRPVPRNEVRRREADLRNLEKSPETAKAWILTRGPYYSQFPDRQPRWWQVRRWWPQARYALKMVWESRSGGRAG